MTKGQPKDNRGADQVSLRWPFWKAILILPGFALVYVPVTILLLTLDTAWAARFASGRPLPLTLGVVLLSAGLLLMYRTMRQFHDADGFGTIAPWLPIATFIVVGPYRYVRNPMLTGVLLVLAGEAMLLQSVPLLLWLGFFFGLNTAYFIRLEEPGLERRFGDAYVRYKSAVPRWIPRLTPYLAPSDAG